MGKVSKITDLIVLIAATGGAILFIRDNLCLSVLLIGLGSYYFLIRGITRKKPVYTDEGNISHIPAYSPALRFLFVFLFLAITGLGIYYYINNWCKCFSCPHECPACENEISSNNKVKLFVYDFEESAPTTFTNMLLRKLKLTIGKDSSVSLISIKEFVRVSDERLLSQTAKDSCVCAGIFVYGYMFKEQEMLCNFHVQYGNSRIDTSIVRDKGSVHLDDYQVPISEIECISEYLVGMTKTLRGELVESNKMMIGLESCFTDKRLMALVESSLGENFYDLKQYDQAKEYMRRAKENDPGNNIYKNKLELIDSVIITNDTTEIQPNSPSDLDSLEEFTVTNIRELLNAIGSDRIIRVKPGKYNFGDIKEDFRSNFVDFIQDVIKMRGLVIHDAHNFAIYADSDFQIDLLTSYDSQVFSFVRCSDFELDNFKIGHNIPPGECGSGVLHFEDCEYGLITNCTMYGSGSVGVSASASDRRSNIDMYFEDCKIYECSNYGIELSFGKYTFESCEIYNNKVQTSVISCRDSTELRIISSKIFENSAIEQDIITSSEWANIELISSEISNNTAYSIGSVETGSKINFSDCRIHNNQVSELFNYSWGADSIDIVTKNTKMYKNPK